jgi:hypothetical protein
MMGIRPDPNPQHCCKRPASLTPVRSFLMQTRNIPAGPRGNGESGQREGEERGRETEGQGAHREEDPEGHGEVGQDAQPEEGISEGGGGAARRPARSHRPAHPERWAQGSGGAAT